MAAYVAMAYLQGTAPRRAGRDATTGIATTATIEDDASRPELVEPPFDDRVAMIRDRFRSAIRHRWDETTFYCFDPESWR